MPCPQSPLFGANAQAPRNVGKFTLPGDGLVKVAQSTLGTGALTVVEHTARIPHRLSCWGPSTRAGFRSGVGVAHIGHCSEHCMSDMPWCGV